MVWEAGPVPLESAPTILPGMSGKAQWFVVSQHSVALLLMGQFLDREFDSRVVHWVVQLTPPCLRCCV